MLRQDVLGQLCEAFSHPRWHSHSRAPPASHRGLGVPRPRTGRVSRMLCGGLAEWLIGRLPITRVEPLNRSGDPFQGGADVRTKQVLPSLIATLSLLVLSAVQVYAQAPPTPTPSTASASGGAGGAIALVLLIVAALVIIGGGVKVYDVRRKRESDAVQLQAQISDALMREQQLAGVPIFATAHASFWRRSAATVEIAGNVPSPQARDAALRIARDEAGRVRSDVQIEDRIAVVPHHAA